MSKISLAIILVIYLISFFIYSRWNDMLLIGGDTGGYYLYLPSAFIYHDLGSMEKTATVALTYRPDLSVPFILAGTTSVVISSINIPVEWQFFIYRSFYLQGCLPICSPFQMTAIQNHSNFSFIWEACCM